METVDRLIFQTDHPEVVNVYNNHDNYKVKMYNGEGVQKDLCMLYFSSNELYYPNTFKAFENSILSRDKFEWQRNFMRTGHKHIFIRDIQKQWYIEGINVKYNDPKGLLKLLEDLTNGFKVYTIGSSAGGFAALYYGSLLKAERVYAFNAQLNLNLVIKNSNSYTDPLLFKYRDTQRKEYLVIDNVLNETTDYFYFQSSKSNFDIEQYNALTKKNRLIRIPFKTSNHGFPFLRHNLSDVLKMDKSELMILSNKHYHPFLFSVSIDGWLKSLKITGQAVFNRIKKKLREKKAS